MVWPVMKLDSSLKRNRITAAISSGLPRRPCGVCSMTVLIMSGGKTCAISVSIRPGATLLMRTLWGAKASAQQRVKAITPAFALA